MAELFQVYGSYGDNEEEQPIQQQRTTAPVYDPNVIPLQQPLQQSQQPSQPPSQSPSQQQRNSHQAERFQNNHEHFTQEYAPVVSNHSQHYLQTQQSQPNQQYKRNTSYSFWDRMALKRSEVIKFAIFALVIVLAIAIDRIGNYYLSKYISDNIFTDFQEFMLRIAYPVIIFLTLWIIKAL
jgi:hypothetical protein